MDDLRYRAQRLAAELERRAQFNRMVDEERAKLRRLAARGVSAAQYPGDADDVFNR